MGITVYFLVSHRWLSRDLHTAPCTAQRCAQAQPVSCLLFHLCQLEKGQEHGLWYQIALGKILKLEPFISEVG